MEPAKSLIARPLPKLDLVRGSSRQSVSDQRVSAALLQPWTEFREDVARSLSVLNLNAAVSKHDEDESYLSGSELGLTARFVRNLCGPVRQALAVTTLAHLTFGDIQCVERQPAHIPDVTVISSVNSSDGRTLRPIIVGELKTFWTLELELYPVTLPVRRLLNLEPHFGQLVSYMRAFDLRFGFLSTYNSTVFVRRADAYRFELSLPILRQDQEPSVRECMLAICEMAAADTGFTEGPDFNDILLRGSGVAAGLQASMRPSQLRAVSSLHPVSSSPTPNTIFIGDQTGTLSVECIRFITGSPELRKAVMEIDFGGQRCIAKFWAPELSDSFCQEAYVYNHLSELTPNGSPFFASLKAHGSIVCSSLVRAGYLLILSWVDGAVLSSSWQQLHRVERDIIRQRCREAIAIFRQMGIYVLDCGMHNILYNPRTHGTVLVDFEMIGACSEEHVQDLNAPEIFAIFGDDSDSVTGG